MVKKKNGELRFCCDYRTLNEVTINDAYPLQGIDENLARLGKTKIFTSIDLTWAFKQSPMRKADRKKQPLHTSSSKEAHVFGICIASATFQRPVARAPQKILKSEGCLLFGFLSGGFLLPYTKNVTVRLRVILFDVTKSKRLSEPH